MEKVHSMENVYKHSSSVWTTRIAKLKTNIVHNSFIAVTKKGIDTEIAMSTNEKTSSGHINYTVLLKYFAGEKTFANEPNQQKN